VNSLQLAVAPALYRGKVVTFSRSSMLELRALGYRDVCVVKLGINLPAPKRVPRENLVVIPGSLKPWKHPDMGIKAFAALPGEFRLALFGIYEPPSTRPTSGGW